MMRILGTILAGLLGLAFGSFLNVCLSRWPEGESVVAPRSHCRSCGRRLGWGENIPLLSWLALRGRCRTCKSAISWRYPLVELAVGALWALIVWQHVARLVALWPASQFPTTVSFSPFFLLQFFGSIVAEMFFFWMLVALAALDAAHLWLPNRLTYPAIAVGFVLSVIPISCGGPIESARWGSSHVKMAIASLLAIAVAAGIILLIRWLYWLVKRQEGIGLGDAKLMAMLAAWLGLPGALLAFAIGVVLGTVVALVALVVPAARRGSDSWAMTRLPLGTFLCVGGIVAALWGPQIIAAYLKMEGF
ncbi:MAG TPA: prepilin peptidase [Terracidiphilus sp.]|nr:prepilin peptidase [Terracidiphilus sp.]